MYIWLTILSIIFIAFCVSEYERNRKRKKFLKSIDAGCRLGFLNPIYHYNPFCPTYEDKYMFTYKVIEKRISHNGEVWIKIQNEKNEDYTEVMTLKKALRQFVVI